MTSPLSALTRRQRETLQVLHEAGWLYKDAAHDLDVPEATVRTRVYHMVKRAKLRHRSELAYWLGVEHAARGIDNRSLPHRRSIPS